MYIGYGGVTLRRARHIFVQFREFRLRIPGLISFTEDRKLNSTK